MRFSIPSARRFRATLRFLILVVACPIGSIHSLGGSFLVEPWLQAATSPEQSILQEPPSIEAPLAPPISEEALEEAETSSLGYGTRAVGAMIVVLTLIWISTILLKRYMPHRFGPLGQQRRMQVLETLPIGDKRTLTLIRIDDAQLLLASTPGSVALLKEVRSEQDTAQTVFRGEPVEASETTATSMRPDQPVLRFADILADEVAGPASASPSNLLQQLVSLRRELEAR